MGGVLGRYVQCALDHLIQLRIRNTARPTGAVFIREPLEPILHETLAPFFDSVPINSEPSTDLVALQTVAQKKRLLKRINPLLLPMGFKLAQRPNF